MQPKEKLTFNQSYSISAASGTAVISKIDIEFLNKIKNATVYTKIPQNTARCRNMLQ